MSEKTVFISYRRDTAGKYFARSIEGAPHTTWHDVFLDVDYIDAGRVLEPLTCGLISSKTVPYLFTFVAD